MYDPKSLCRVYQAPIAAGDMVSEFLYGTTDAAATVETAGYFTDKRLKKGDLISACMARSGTPVRKGYVITAVSTAGVATIALGTTTAG